MNRQRLTIDTPTSPQRKLRDGLGSSHRLRATDRDPELPLGAGDSSLSTHRSSQHAFSLVEMLVVVTIIIILLGIGLSVGGYVLNKGEETKTKITLANADTLLDQYLAETKQSVDDVFGDLSDNSQGVNRLFGRASQVKRLEPLFGGFDKRALKESSGTWTLYDGWDNEIHLKWADGIEPSGGDLPDEGRPYFASRGLNGEWGTYNATTPDEAEADNFYSFRSNE